MTDATEVLILVFLIATYFFATMIFMRLTDILDELRGNDSETSEEKKK